MEKVCGNCDYWHLTEEQIKESKDHGGCYRYPPTSFLIHNDPRNGAYMGWPIVAANGRACGEFKPKDDQ